LLKHLILLVVETKSKGKKKVEGGRNLSHVR